MLNLQNFHLNLAVEYWLRNSIVAYNSWLCATNIAISLFLEKCLQCNIAQSKFSDARRHLSNKVTKRFEISISHKHQNHQMNMQFTTYSHKCRTDNDAVFRKQIIWTLPFFTWKHDNYVIFWMHALVKEEFFTWQYLLNWSNSKPKQLRRDKDLNILSSLISNPSGLNWEENKHEFKVNKEILKINP